jgi:peptidoglycan/LPS O-acetylase OafA/YrhL
VAWTLCVEVTYYVALPVWAIAMRRLGGGYRSRIGGRGWLATELASLTLVVIAGLAVQLVAAQGQIGSLVAASLAGQCLWLAIGMLFAALSVARQRGELRLDSAVRAIEAHATACWVGAAVAYVGLMALAPRGGLFGLIAATETRQSLIRSAARIALEAAVVSLLVAPAVFGDGRRGAPRRLLRLRPVVWLGVISYSFYLWHLTIVELIATPGRSAAFSASGLNLLGHLHAARTLVLYLVSFAAATAVASVSYRFIELPFLRRK